MKKIVAVALVSLAMSNTIMANNMYIGVGFGIDNISIPEISDNYVDNGSFMELSIGKVLSNNIGFEVKLTTSTSSTLIADEVEIDTTTLSVFGTYTFDINEKFKIVSKIGLSNFSTNAYSLVYEESYTDSNIGVVGAVDFKYVVTKKINGYVGLTVFSPEIDNSSYDSTHYSMGIQYKF